MQIKKENSKAKNYVGTVLLTNKGGKKLEESRDGSEVRVSTILNGGIEEVFSHNGKISARQVMILSVLQMFNVGTLILPRVCTQYVGRNGYILPILAIILGIIYLLCIYSLTSAFPQHTFVEILQNIMPAPIGNIIVVIFILKILGDIGLELRMFGELISQIMLTKTPIEVIILIMLLTVSYLAKSGIEALGRMGEILIYFIFIPLGIALLIGILNTDYREVMPFFQTNLKDVGFGTLAVSFTFVPLELLLMINALMIKPKKMLKAGIVSIIIIGILEALIVLLTICKIGSAETQRQIWPGLMLMQSINMSNSVVQKQEIIMMIVWIFSVFMYICSGLCIVSIMGSRCCHFKRENIFVLPLIPIIYFIAIWPQNLVDIYTYYLKYQYYFGIWFMVPIPLILSLIARIRRIGDEK